MENKYCNPGLLYLFTICNIFSYNVRNGDINSSIWEAA